MWVVDIEFGDGDCRGLVFTMFLLVHVGHRKPLQGQLVGLQAAQSQDHSLGALRGFEGFLSLRAAGGFQGFGCLDLRLRICASEMWFSKIRAASRRSHPLPKSLVTGARKQQPILKAQVYQYSAYLDPLERNINYTAWCI